MKPKLFLAAVIVMSAAIGAVIWVFASQWNDALQASANDGYADSRIVDVTLPETFSANAQIGQTAYEAQCVACHGVNAAGQVNVAPPLVHTIYEPSHHGDGSFYRAAETGVRAHHWPFGNMPAVEGITRDEVTMIIAYIRELQRANGID